MARTKNTEKKNPPERIILSDVFFQELLQFKNPDAIVLYSFYRLKTIHQKTNQVWANEEYCMKVIGFGYDRLKKAKKFLSEIGLINELKHIKKADGSFDKTYILVNYTFKPRDCGSSISGKNKADQSSNSLKSTVDRSPGFRVTETRGINALRRKQINIEEVCTSFGKGFPAGWMEDDLFKTTTNKFILHRKEKNQPITEQALNLIREKLISFGSPKNAIVSMQNSIIKGYPDVYPQKDISQQNSSLNVCPIAKWTFGKDFNPSKQGCYDCEDDSPKIYKACKKAYHEEYATKKMN